MEMKGDSPAYIYIYINTVKLRYIQCLESVSYKFLYDKVL